MLQFLAGNFKTTDSFFFFVSSQNTCLHKDCGMHAHMISMYTSPGVLFTKRVNSFTTCNKVSVRAFLIADSGIKTFVGHLVEIAYTETSACAPSKALKTPTHTLLFLLLEKQKKGPITEATFMTQGM